MKTPATAPWAKIAFGVDVVDSHPIIVKASYIGRTLAFETIASHSLPPTQPAQSVWAGCLLQKESFTRWLTAPLSSAKKAEKVFPSLLDVQLPFSVEDCEYALLETRPTEDRTATRGLVAGARTVDIEKRLALFSALSLDPHLLDQEALALWTQALDEAPPVAGGPEVRIIIYQSSERVTLSIGQKDQFLGAHTMRQLDTDQIHRLLKSYFPTPPPLTQWILTGPDASHQTSGNPALAPLAARWNGAIKMTRDPATFLARALATRALTAGELRCHLRTGVFLHPSLARRATREPYRWAIALLTSGLLLCSINIGWKLFLNQRAAAIQKNLHSLAVEITGSPVVPRGQEVLAAHRAMETQTKAMEPFLAAIDMPIPDTLRMILLTAKEEGLGVENVIMSRKNVVLHGLAAKLGQPEAVIQHLKNQGWNANLERKESPPGDERVAFVISLSRSHEKK